MPYPASIGGIKVFHNLASIPNQMETGREDIIINRPTPWLFLVRRAIFLLLHLLIFIILRALGKF
jgi:hypothetical protein